MWRVLFRTAGSVNDDAHVFDDLDDAWNFAAGLLQSDRHRLLVELHVETAIGDAWIRQHSIPCA